jgi:molybdate transport system substrate-binding protein
MDWRYVALAVWVLVTPPALQEEPLTVSAAVSLTDALNAVGPAYAAGGGGPVRFNFGGSNTLARQIAAGAPVDLFISADQVQMEVADRVGAIERSTRVDLLGNRLAVIVPRGRASTVTDVRALLQVRRLALGDPEAVPAGVYAREYLSRLGLWESLQSRVVPVGNVRAAVAAVANLSAGAAIVYESDASSSAEVEVAFVVTGPQAPRIVYPAAVTTVSKHRAAALRFLTYLRGRDAGSIFSRFKFVPLG